MKCRLISVVSAAAVVCLGVQSHAFAQALDGNWVVKKMECGGEKANKQTKNMLKNPNFVSVQISGETGAFVDKFNGCTKTIPLSISYPSPDLVVASFNGPIQCSPASCDAACGLDLPLTVAYEVSIKKDKMEWTSIGSVDDNCTKNGQQNPIFYEMRDVSKDNRGHN